MTKGTKLSEFEKAILKLWKGAENLSEIFWRLLDAVKPWYAITWKIQICIEEENRLAGQKNYLHNSRKNCSRSRKGNLFNIKNIEISSGWMLIAVLERIYTTKKLGIRKEFIIKGWLWSTKRNDWNMLISIKPWVLKKSRNVVFSDEEKFNLDDPDGFQKYGHAKKKKRKFRRELLNKA